LTANPDDEEWYTDAMFEASCCGDYDCRAPGANWYDDDDGDLWCL
jgi:hypothetical protein